MFKKKDGAGQESLFNVMKAYSVHDREVKVNLLTKIHNKCFEYLKIGYWIKGN